MQKFRMRQMKIEMRQLQKIAEIETAWTLLFNSQQPSGYSLVMATS